MKQLVNDLDQLNSDDAERVNALPPKLRAPLLGKLRDGLATAEARRERARAAGETFLETDPRQPSKLDRAGWATPQKGA
jgi:hypothetical protein